MKSKTGAVLLLLGVFVLGAIAGAVSASLYDTQIRRHGPGFPPFRGGPPPDIVGELADELELNPDQKLQLQKIFQQVRERYRSLAHESNQEIRKILREDQIDDFRKIVRAAGKRHRQRHRDE